MSSINYNEIDREARELVKMLNLIPGISTFESCSGHGERNFHVYLRASNISALNKFMWAFCWRYGNIGAGPNPLWTLEVCNIDTNRYSESLTLLLKGQNPAIWEKEHNLTPDDIARGIDRWIGWEIEEGAKNATKSDKN